MQQLNCYTLQTKIKINSRVIIVIIVHKNSCKEAIKLN